MILLCLSSDMLCHNSLKRNNLLARELCIRVCVIPGVFVLTLSVGAAEPCERG